MPIENNCLNWCKLFTGGNKGNESPRRIKLAKSADEELPSSSKNAKGTKKDAKLDANADEESGDETNSKRVNPKNVREMWVMERRPTKNSSWWCLHCHSWREKKSKHSASVWYSFYFAAEFVKFQKTVLYDSITQILCLVLTST